jgi:hypothetical protein
LRKSADFSASVEIFLISAKIHISSDILIISEDFLGSVDFFQHQLIFSISINQDFSRVSNNEYQQRF